MNINQFDYNKWKDLYNETVEFIDEWISSNVKPGEKFDSLYLLFNKERRNSEFKQQLVAVLIRDNCDIYWTPKLCALLANMIASTSKLENSAFKKALIDSIHKDHEKTLCSIFDECIEHAISEREEIYKDQRIDDWKYKFPREINNRLGK